MEIILISNAESGFNVSVPSIRSSGKNAKTLSTLRYRTFAIGAYSEWTSDTLKLKIALTKKRRKWFAGLWDYPIDWSQKIATA